MSPILAPPLDAILRRALGAPPPFARAVATDADGTLWARDVGDELFLHVARAGLFRGAGLAKLRAHAAQWLGPAHTDDDPRAIAEALFARYSRGEIDVRVMCDLEAETVGDRDAQDFDALVADVAARIATTVRDDVRALLHAARDAGAVIHVVTGSLGCAVEATLARADIPFDRVSGAELARGDGRVHAALVRASPLFEGKVLALRDGGAWPAALGLGDGGWDHTFLREVHVPVLVHPKPALRDAMRDVPRAVTLGAD